jgi:uncharacterized membrane protein
VLFGFISFIALKEFFTMVPLRHEDRTPMFIAYLFIPLQYYFAAVLDHHGLFMMSIIVYGVAMVAIVMVLKQKVDEEKSDKYQNESPNPLPYILQIPIIIGKIFRNAFHKNSP